MKKIIDNTLLDIFFEDSIEMIDLNINLLLDLEKSYDKNKVDDIMRNLHSIKGNSDMVELEKIRNFSHELEDCFAKIESDDIEGNSKLVNALLDSLKLLKNFINIRYNLYINDDKEFNKELDDMEKYEDSINKIRKYLDEEEDENKKANILKKKVNENIGSEYQIKMFFKDALSNDFHLKNYIPSELRNVNFLNTSQNNVFEIICNSKLSPKEIGRKIGNEAICVLLIKDMERLENTIYIKKGINIENIERIYEMVIKINKIKKLYVNKNNTDIYGEQFLESFKKGGIKIEEEYL
ncbi:MAG: Hpt domain-containing protein [Fusobacteriota bacterium]